MFDALHEELKGYKDGFLLESVHKPIIRDLISLYDDLARSTARCRKRWPSAAPTPRATEPQASGNGCKNDGDTTSSTICEFIVEVLARLEVTSLPVGIGQARQAHAARGGGGNRRGSR